MPLKQLQLTVLLVCTPKELGLTSLGPENKILLRGPSSPLSHVDHSLWLYSHT